MLRDYFADLELTPDSNIEEVRRAYRRLARRFHPDLNPLDTYAHQSFLRIQEAFEQLSTVTKIIKLKKQDGPEIQIHGSGNLIQTLLKHDLIDEFQVWTFPLTIGNGKRLFGEGTIPAGFRLLDCKSSTTGVIIAIYARDGKIKTGSFALEKPTEAELARRKRLKEEKK